MKFLSVATNSSQIRNKRPLACRQAGLAGILVVLLLCLKSNPDRHFRPNGVTRQEYRVSSIPSCRHPLATAFAGAGSDRQKTSSTAIGIGLACRNWTALALGNPAQAFPSEGRGRQRPPAAIIGRNNCAAVSIPAGSPADNSVFPGTIGLWAVNAPRLPITDGLPVTLTGARIYTSTSLVDGFSMSKARPKPSMR